MMAQASPVEPIDSQTYIITHTFSYVDNQVLFEYTNDLDRDNTVTRIFDESRNNYLQRNFYPIEYIKVFNRGEIDLYDFNLIIQGMGTRRHLSDVAGEVIGHGLNQVETKTQALKLFNYLKEFRQYDETYYPEWTNAERNLRVYGYGWCSDYALVLRDLLRSIGLEAHYVQLNAHAVTEVFLAEAGSLIDPHYELFFLDNSERKYILPKEKVVNNHIVLDATYAQRYRQHFIRASDLTEYFPNFAPYYIEYLSAISNDKFRLRPDEYFIFYSNRPASYRPVQWPPPLFDTLYTSIWHVFKPTRRSGWLNNSASFGGSVTMEDGLLNSLGPSSFWSYNILLPNLITGANLRADLIVPDQAEVTLSLLYSGVVLSQNVFPPGSHNIYLDFGTLLLKRAIIPYAYEIRFDFNNQNENVPIQLSNLELMTEMLSAINAFPHFESGDNLIELNDISSFPDVEVEIKYNLTRSLKPKHPTSLRYSLESDKISFSWKNGFGITDFHLIISDEAECEYAFSPNFDVIGSIMPYDRTIRINQEMNNITFELPHFGFFRNGKSYYWKVRVQNSEETWSDWSRIGRISLPFSKTISAPNTPSGPTSGTTGISYSYSTGGLSSGHSIKYQFDWKGDGSDLSPWGSATQSKTWTISGTYYVRTRARSSKDNSVVSDWSSGLTVTIVPPSLTVISPNGGEIWKVGTTQTIRWSYAGNPGRYVEIQLLKGGVVTPITGRRVSIGIRGNGFYNWRIPSTQTPGQDYKIRVTSTSDSAYQDSSDNDFTIMK